MIFLIAYSRSGGLLKMESFPTTEMTRAQANRAALVRTYLQQLSDVEIALFESEDEATLRRTHARYFETTPQLTGDLHRALDKTA